MNKILTISCCLLGLAMACVPAYASPMRKKITIDCSNVMAPDSITGTATVTLCASSATDNCATSYLCPSTPVSCDSNGTISVTVTCDAPFKVDYVTGHADVLEYDGNGNFVGTGGSDINSTLGGKGYYKLYPTNPPGTGAVALTIK